MSDTGVFTGIIIETVTPDRVGNYPKMRQQVLPITESIHSPFQRNMSALSLLLWMSPKLLAIIGY